MEPIDLFSKPVHLLSHLCRQPFILPFFFSGARYTRILQPHQACNTNAILLPRVHGG
jgi:hypothetical protein